MLADPALGSINSLAQKMVGKNTHQVQLGEKQ